MKAKHALPRAARSVLTVLVLLCPIGEVTATADLKADQERLDQARRALQAGKAETEIMYRLRDTMKEAVDRLREAEKLGAAFEERAATIDAVLAEISFVLRLTYEVPEQIMGLEPVCNEEVCEAGERTDSSCPEQLEEQVRKLTTLESTPLLLMETLDGPIKALEMMLFIERNLGGLNPKDGPKTRVDLATQALDAAFKAHGELASLLGRYERDALTVAKELVGGIRAPQLTAEAIRLLRDIEAQEAEQKKILKETKYLSTRGLTVVDVNDLALQVTKKSASDLAALETYKREHTVKLNVARSALESLKTTRKKASDVADRVRKAIGEIDRARNQMEECLTADTDADEADGGWREAGGLETISADEAAEEEEEPELEGWSGGELETISGGVDSSTMDAAGAPEVTANVCANDRQLNPSSNQLECVCVGFVWDPVLQRCVRDHDPELWRDIEDPVVVHHWIERAIGAHGRCDFLAARRFADQVAARDPRHPWLEANYDQIADLARRQEMTIQAVGAARSTLASGNYPRAFSTLDRLFDKVPACMWNRISPVYNELAAAAKSHFGRAAVARADAWMAALGQWMSMFDPAAHPGASGGTGEIAAAPSASAHCQIQVHPDTGEPGYILSHRTTGYTHFSVLSMTPEEASQMKARLYTNQRLAGPYSGHQHARNVAEAWCPQ